MIIRLAANYQPDDLKILDDVLTQEGFEIKHIKGHDIHIVHVLGDTSKFDEKKLYAYPFIKDILRITEPFPMVNRKNKTRTIVSIGDLKIGDGNLIYIAGPCSVESQEQINTLASSVKASGVHVLRGGAYKPRTSPYAFQGLKENGLKMLHSAGMKYGLKTVSEIVSKEDIPLFNQYVDIIQVGARNMQNFDLLKALGNTKRPILLKRGFGNTIDEWLMSAEYIITSGNHNIILCERGIRTFEPYTRDTLDLSSILAIKSLSHLPVIIDPSHAAGRWELVSGLARAGVAAGADGVMVEVHHEPERAFSDGGQSLKPKKLKTLIDTLNRIKSVL